MAKVTSKGQITIPVEVRKALGLRPGVRIDFHEIEDGEYVFRAKAGSIREMRGCIPRPNHTLSIEEMDQGIADNAGELDDATMTGHAGDSEDGEVD